MYSKFTGKPINDPSTLVQPEVDTVTSLFLFLQDHLFFSTLACIAFVTMTAFAIKTGFSTISTESTKF